MAGRQDSWKEIAAHLNRSVRTLRRWGEEGQPVHRLQHEKGGSVYSYRLELDAWRQSRVPDVGQALFIRRQCTEYSHSFSRTAKIFRGLSPWMPIIQISRMSSEVLRGLKAMRVPSRET